VRVHGCVGLFANETVIIIIIIIIILIIILCGGCYEER